MLQRNVTIIVFIIVKHRVTLRESSAPAVLSAETDRKTFAGKTCKRERFRSRPIERLFSGGHFTAAIEKFFNLRMRMKTLWQFRLFFQQGDQLLSGNSGFGFRNIFKCAADIFATTPNSLN